MSGQCGQSADAPRCLPRCLVWRRHSLIPPTTRRRPLTLSVTQRGRPREPLPSCHGAVPLLAVPRCEGAVRAPGGC